MRVGFDARWYNDSGVGAYVAGLLRAIGAAQREFELLVYEDPENRAPGLDGLPILRVPVRAPKYSFREQWELGRRARLDKLDLFHSPFYVVPLSPGCPVVVTVHDLIPFLFRIYRWPKQWMVTMGYRMAVRRAQHIIADSENTAKDVREILSVPQRRITAVHIAAAPEFTAESPADDLSHLQEKHGIYAPYVVVASARNWGTKNLESAMQALDIVRSSGIEFQTVVYGPEDGINALNARERWGRLNLHALGYVAGGDLAMLFRHAHVFLMPSLYEGFGLPILEAMSCGCAVVTSKAGSLAEIAGQGAQLFAPLDIGGMAGAVIRLLRNPEELHRWRVSALRRAADFSWDKAAMQTISVYHRIHEQSSRRSSGLETESIMEHQPKCER